MSSALEDLFNNNNNAHNPLDDIDDIPNPLDFGGLDSLYVPKATDSLPPAALITLQILFYTFLAIVLLYLISHWIFYSWSFMNIFNLGMDKRKKINASLSDRLIPLVTVIMFLLYTAYMVAFVFVTIFMMQFSKYYKGFLSITTKATRNQINLFLWLFFAMAMFPFFVNIFMTLIKIAKDALFNSRSKTDFQERINNLVQTHPEEVNFSPVAPTALTTKTGEFPVIPHSSALLPDMADNGLPLVYIMIPVYNEPLPVLMGALNGVAASDYPRLRVYVGFDNYDVEQTFFTLCRLMTGVPLKATLGRQPSHDLPMPTPPYMVTDYDDNIDIQSDMGRKVQKYNGFDQIVGSPSIRGHSFDIRSPAMTPVAHPTGADTPPSSLFGSFSGGETNDADLSADNCPDEYTLEYRGVRFTIHRFQHSGKLGTQRSMFERMQTELTRENNTEEPMILFMDSDTAIMPDCMSEMVNEMQRRPETKACTGFVVSRNEDSYNLLRIMQDAEYIESMIFRNSEAILGAVTCLPGVLTMFKYTTLCDVASDYFYQGKISGTFDFCRRYLGEDRFMTHLLMERHDRNSLAFNFKAICKTEAPSDFYNLLRQRRRWFLGSISNDLYMICTPGFWVKYPILQLTKFFMHLKVGGALSYILMMELLFNLIFDAKTTPLSLVFWLFVIIVPNWLFVTVWAILERRLKSVLVFPIYYWFNPFFTIILLMYSFLTVRQNTWGGPRTDSSKSKTQNNTIPNMSNVVVIQNSPHIRSRTQAPRVPASSH